MNTLIKNIVRNINLLSPLFYHENMMITLEMSLVDYKKRGTEKYKYSSIEFDKLRKEINGLKEICDEWANAKIDEWVMWNVDYVDAHEINQELNNYHRYCKKNNIEISSPHVQECIRRDIYSGYRNIRLNYED